MKKPQLYPLTFEPIYKEKIWGGRKLAELFDRDLPEGQIGESWDVAAHPNGMSVVDQGELEGRTLQELIEMYGSELGVSEEKFPLLLKFIDAADDLSVQVHPDDDYAAAHEGDELGKTEMWYIVHSEPGGRIIWGTKEGVTRDDFARALQTGGQAVLDCLNQVEVKAGDIFPISAGLIHALGKGVVVAEIQQNSDTTYRVYDWDRVDETGKGRELHIDKALDVTDFSPEARSFDYQYERCAKYFQLRVLEAPVKQALDLSGRFHLLTPVTASAVVHWDGGELALRKAQACLIPACLGEYAVSSSGVALLNYLP
jgi:mannose-6-phosphate isomerase